MPIGLKTQYTNEISVEDTAPLTFSASNYQSITIYSTAYKKVTVTTSSESAFKINNVEHTGSGTYTITCTGYDRIAMSSTVGHSGTFVFTVS